MFRNIGGKIKTLAKVTTILWIILWTILGIIMMFGRTTSTFNGYSYYSSGFTFGSFIMGLMVIAIGCLVSWVGSFLLYGFGELVENSAIVAQNTAKAVTGAESTAPAMLVHPSGEKKIWVCQSCKRTNSEEHIFCKECGKAK